MEAFIPTLTANVPTLALLVARIGGLVFFLPLFGMGTLPARFRLVFSLALGIRFPAGRLFEGLL